MARSGQVGQAGFLGVQIRAPSSINPWFSAPGSSASASAAAISHSRRRAAASATSSATSKTRAKMRVTFPSTTGTRRPKAIEAIAPAVYRPIPGSARSASASAGTSPPWRSTTILAAAWRFRARA